MAVAMTSRMAYEHLRATGKVATQKARILAEILEAPQGISRRALAEITGMELGAVAGRCNDLVKESLVLEDGERTCSWTGRTVKLLKPIGSHQGELF